MLLRATLRGQARRLLSAGIAVALGVLFLAVTLVLSDTLAATIEKQAAGDIASYAAVVSAPEGGPLEESTATKARGAAGVAAVDPVIQGGAMLGTDTFVALGTAPPPGRGTYLRGRGPTALGEVALTESALAALHTEVGQSVSVAGAPAGAPRLTVVGVLDPGPETPVPPSVPAGVATNATLLALGSGYAEIRVIGAEGTSPEQVRDAVAAAVGPDLQVLTGAEDAHRRVEELAGGRDLLGRVLVVFASVALFTCVLVVANTFTILLAQRRRQLALLRCVGAGRGQLVRAVLAEAAVLGTVASAAGLVAALGLAHLAVLAARRFGGDLVPDLSLTVRPAALLVPVTVGVFLTMLAALAPAVRATRISPLTALRPELPPLRRVRVARLVLGALAGVGGVVLLVLGVRTGRLEFGIPGGFLSFAGILALGPLLVPVLVGLLRRPARRLAGAPGVLAVENARRNPQRAAATTSALLVGVTLITMMTTGAGIARRVAADEIDGQMPVDATVSAVDPSGDGLTAAQVARLQAVPGVAAATTVRVRPEVTLRSATGETFTTLTVLDPDSARAVVRAAPVIDALAPGTVLLDRDTAASLQVGDGGTVRLPWGGARVQIARVDGAVVAAGEVPAGRGQAVLWVRFADDADVEATATALNGATADMDGVLVTSPAQLREQIDRAVDAVLLASVALLAVAVLIALVGVGNTLGLSVLERTRESALLRALGLTTGQLRGMLAVEAVVLSGVALVLGSALGIAYGWAGIATLFADMPDAGVPLVIPWGRLVLVAVVALGAGLLASLLPARRAVRVAPAQALAAE